MKGYRVRRGAGLLWLVVMIVAGMPGWSPAQSPAAGPGAQAWRLRKEQAEILEKAVKQYEMRFRVGQVGIVELIAVRKELLATRLGQDKGVAAQLEVLETEIEKAKGLEAVLKAQFENGTATESAVLLAKAYRLGIEIRVADRNK